MEGSNRMALHTTNLQTPYALTIDYTTQTLYWADYALNKLESSNTDGSNRRLLTTNIRDPYAMTFFADVLYWSDWSYDGIYSTHTASPSRVTSLLNVGADPYGIQVIDRDIQFNGTLFYVFHMQDSYIVLKLFVAFIYAVSNPCSVNNGNCSYICLLSAVTPSRFSCVCPGDYIPTENQTHCKCKIHTESMHNNYSSTTCMYVVFFFYLFSSSKIAVQCVLKCYSAGE